MSDNIVKFPERPKEKDCLAFSPETVAQLQEMRKSSRATIALALLAQEDGSLQLLAEGNPSFYDVRYMLTRALNYTYDAEGESF